MMDYCCANCAQLAQATTLIDPLRTGFRLKVIEETVSKMQKKSIGESRCYNTTPEMR